MARPSRIPDWLAWEQTTVYFVTFCAQKRKSVLANPRAWELCLNILKRLDHWHVFAAIAMPDHLDLLAAPLDPGGSVAAFSKWFKRWFKVEYCRSPVSNGEGAHEMTSRWQEGCFARLL